MKVKYIAIEREYGSAGTEIARLCADKSGVNCYGKEIMEEISKKVNLPVKDLERYERKLSGSILYSMFLMSQSQTGNPDLMSNEAKIFVAASKVIKDLALNGPAIFVGHCASHVLKDLDGVVKVFIHASEESKKQRIISSYGIDESKVDATCKDYNKKRANYYSFCTQRKWNDYSNYDLVLDSSKLGIQKSADLLASLF